MRCHLTVKMIKDVEFHLLGVTIFVRHLTLTVKLIKDIEFHPGVTIFAFAVM